MIHHLLTFNLSVKWECCLTLCQENVKTVQQLTVITDIAQVSNINICIIIVYDTMVSDPARCPCVNFDEPGQFYCDGKVNGTTLFPDMTDCASYLNCTSGCMEPILVTSCKIAIC